MKRSNIILTVLHAHSQSHIITASILIFSDTRPRPVQIRQTKRGSWWNTSIATAHCIPICMQMVYQENSIPSNQQVKNNCNLHFRATVQSLMNRKDRRKWQTYERIDFHWQLVWLVLYSTLMSWNSQDEKKKALFFIYKLHKKRVSQVLCRIVSNLQISHTFLWNLKKGKPSRCFPGWLIKHLF